MADVKDLRIKVGVLKRALKENQMYRKEVNDVQAELDSMDPTHDKYGQIMQTLEESKAMLLDSTNRIPDAVENLEVEMDSHDPSNELCQEGKKLIAEAKALQA